MVLLLFTSTFPFDAGAEQTFLNKELYHLKAAFDRVILIPRKGLGKRLIVPDEIEVDESFIHFLNSNRFRSLLRAVFSPIIYKDISARPSILLQLDALKRLIKFTEIANLTQLWVEDWLGRSGIQARNCLFYTYWFDDIPMGIGLAKHNYPDICLVSRAHNYDLYEERYAFNYWPCRPSALALLDRLFVDSEAGRQYMSRRYPQFESKYRTSLLGVGPAGFVTAQSEDGTFRIVSCSYLVPVKRVELILEGVACAARLKPEIRFEWHHFGDGDTRTFLQDRARTAFPSNVREFFPGYLAPQDLFQFYKDNAVDVFINVSTFEGTPVSIMEALSYSIPVIATAVGGNQEIVSSKNGLLLSPDPSPEEIAHALLEIQSYPETTARKRIESYNTWRDKYNADSNFQLFAESLRTIRSR